MLVLGKAVALPEPPGFGNGSGGVLSTAGDMARWLIAQNNGILTPSSVRQMRTPPRRTRSTPSAGPSAKPRTALPSSNTAATCSPPPPTSC
ncbi:serine hydrolase [Streptosporangium lutulentum]